MKHPSIPKKGILLGMACLLLLGLTACSCSQQTTPLPTDDIPVYATLAPAPTVAPTSTEGLETWDQDGLVTIVTPQPQATAVAATATVYATPTPSPSPQPTSSSLRNGDSGERVRTVQQRLKELGYLSGSVDGVFGNATEEAVRAFQEVNGLTADGVVGTRTLEKLQSSSAKSKPKESSVSDTASATSVPRPISYTASDPSTYGYLQLGSTGKDVTKLQNRLIELGYLEGTASGTFDEETEAAVIAFQVRNGQWDDGIAGQDTQSRLYSDDALAAQK